MRNWRFRRPVLILVVALMFVLPVLSCATTPAHSSFYDSGTSSLSITAQQFSDYFLYSFNTSESELTFTFPSAADMVSVLPSAYEGEVVVFGISANGANGVNLVGGQNVNIRPSAATVAPNSTLMVYIVFNNVSSGSEAATVY